MTVTDDTPVEVYMSAADARWLLEKARNEPPGINARVHLAQALAAAKAKVEARL